MTAISEPPVASLLRKNLPVCIISSEGGSLEEARERLSRAGFPAVAASGAEGIIEKMRALDCRVALLDTELSARDGLEGLERLLQHDPGIYVIVASEGYTVDAAIAAVRRGAYDFLRKPLDYARLLRTLDELGEVFAQRSQVRELQAQLLGNLEFHGIIAKSAAMLEVFDLTRKVAKHYQNALISGPTGCGKELVARALHSMSPVNQERFAVCNCSALVDTLLESQLFGHLRGAFTGASDTRAGLFEYAQGGTVFLDEVGEMSLGMQAKLLRVIQNREIQRVGSPEVKRVNVRLIAATNRDLRAEVLEGGFREDLFYRLSSIEIYVPGLAARPEDISLLVQHFVNKYNEAYGKRFRGLTRRAQMALMRHEWPGNVRELENVISSAAITAGSDFIDLNDLPEHLQRSRRRIETSEDWRPLPLAEMRRLHIERVLQMCNGNRVRASQILGIGRTSLYRHLRRSGGPAGGRHAA